MSALRKLAAIFAADVAGYSRLMRQDEAGTPYCFTIDGQTLQDNTVTIRDRDTLKQERLPLAEVQGKLPESFKQQR